MLFFLMHVAVRRFLRVFCGSSSVAALEVENAVLRHQLAVVRRTVERQDFVSGKAPAYADYIVFGGFQWARAISDFEVLAPDDPIAAWRGRMLDLFEGFARRAPAYGG